MKSPVQLNNFMVMLFYASTALCICLGLFNNVVVESTEVSCFGISASNPSVCSGRGSCIANDTCSCMDLYTNQTVDYLDNFNSKWGLDFALPVPNTLFSKYSINKTDGQYPTFSITTKQKVQDMWSCSRGEGELILNEAPINIDGALFNEWSFELTMDMSVRDDLTHAGIVLWRDTKNNTGGKNYYLGSGPTNADKIDVAVNDDKYCDVLPENLPGTKDYTDGPFTVASTATLIPLKVRKYPLGYKFYYKTPSGTDWIKLGTVPNSIIFDRIGIFVKQWSTLILWAGGPISFDVKNMNLRVPKFTGSTCNVTSCFGISSTSNTVCNGKGICSDFNTCTCQEGYSGSSCLTFTPTISNSTDVSNSTSTNNTNISSNNTNIDNSTLSNNTNMSNNTNELSNGTITSNNTNISNNSNISNNNTIVDNSTVSNSTNMSNSSNVLGNETINANHTTISNTTNVVDNSTITNTTTSNFTDVTNSSISNTSVITNSSIVDNTTNSQNTSTNPTSNNSTTVTCNGISADNSSACNGNGNCTTNGCVCSSFFTGSNCEIPLCYGIAATDKSVCNSNGECTLPNVCKCKTSYEGDSCGSFKCFDISKSSATVCGGHGSCTSVDTCECNSNWNGNAHCTECSSGLTGQFCNETMCSDEKTCNGRGKCDSNQKCVCNANFVGDSCTSCASGYFGTNCDKTCTATVNCSSHGNCNSEGECVCTGHFSGKTCTSCQSGWYGENCDYSIDTSSFSFNKNGDVISGTVYSSISTKFDCSYFISTDSIQMIGGSEAVCEYSSSEHSFQITLRPSATILPGQALSFFSDLQNKKNLISVTVSAGSLQSDPTVVLKSDKSIISTCDKVSFDASSSSSLDRRSLTYTWISPTPALNSLISSLNSSFITLQPNSLSVGTYLILVKVKTQFGFYATQNTTFSVVSTVVPSVNIPEETIVMIGKSLIISPSVNFPSCYSGNSSLLKITYSVEPNSADTSLKLVSNNRMLIFGSGYTSINKEGNYYIKASVTSDQALDTSVIFIVKATSQPLQLSFNVTDYSQGYDEAVSFSVEKNDPSSTSDSEALTITCFKISTSTSCGSVTSPFNQLLSPGQYSFTAKYSKGSRTTEKVLLVNILSKTKDMVIKASITAQPQGISQSIDLSAVDSSQDLVLNSNLLDTLTNPSYTWTSPNLDLTKLESKRSYISIPKSNLIPGSTISLDLSITDGNRNGSASISFTVNYPPTKGAFEVFPKSGFSLDEYDVKCGNDWNDPQTPLSYQYFFNDGVYWKPLSEKLVDLKSIRVRLAAGLASNSYNVPVKVIVSDAKGASTESIVQVNIQNLSVEQTVNVLSSISSQVSSISSTDASNALLAIGSVTNSSMDSAQKEKIAKLANNLVAAVISSKTSQSSLVPETSESASSTASVISNAIPAVSGGLITDQTTSLIISTLASTTGTVASVKEVNLDSNTISSVLAATNALSEHVSTRRRSLNTFTDDDLKKLGVTYTNIVAVSTKNDAPDMPASVVIGNGVIGYSRKISNPSMNNFYDILYNSNTITLSSTFSKLIPNVPSASFRFMIYDKRNAISKFSLDSNFQTFTRVIEFNIVPEKSYAPMTLSNPNLFKLKMQTLKNETSIPDNTDLVCKKYNDKTTSFLSDSGCTIGNFVKDSVVADISSTGVYTLQAIVKENIVSQANSNITISVLLVVISIFLFLLA